MAIGTIVIEIPTLPSPRDQPVPLQTPSRGSLELTMPMASHVVETKQRWNSPRINTYRLAAIFFAFINFGMNDGSYGALIPYVGKLSSSQLGK